MTDRILRRRSAPAIPDAYINEAAAILLDSRDPHSGLIRAETAIDRLAAVLLARDEAAASLDASNQQIIGILKAVAGIPAGTAITPALMSKEMGR